MLPAGAGRYTEYFTLSGISTKEIPEIDADNDPIDATVVTERENGGLVEIVVGDSCPAVTLTEFGAIPNSVTSSEGTLQITASVLPEDDTTELIDAFLTDYPTAELVAKRTKTSDRPVFSGVDIRETISSALTERQEEVLRCALEGGYYDQPRSTTAAELASELGISQPTFSQHLRSAERKALSVIYDD